MEPQPLLFKPDWPRACRRWRAFWNLEPVDRPCLDITAPLPVEPPPPSACPEDMEAFWFDADFTAERLVRQLGATYYAGESVPADGAHLIMLGWTLGCGPEVRFTRETIWLPELMREGQDASLWNPGTGDPWRKKLGSVLRRLLEEAKGRFLVGYPCPMVLNDLLPLLLGSQMFLMEMAEDIERCRRTLIEMAAPWHEAAGYFREIIRERQAGHVWGWPGLWHSEPVAITQSDMSCMISGEMFDRFVLAELDILAEHSPIIWYHLDGPGAVRHLPRLLSRPYIRAIQWVPGSGNPDNGPAYLDLYRQVQAAGRCLDLSAGPDNIEFLIRRLNPEGLVLRTWAASPEEADELIDNAVKWCGSHLRRN
ncbi:MAG: hypothetical protein IT210_15080 [Armatimonadetes bacterium]|nr:hypothetical protein [Armatimonadota bacterium]